MPQLVLLADQLLAPVPGGTGRYTRQLGAALARTAPEGWRISTVISRGGDPAMARIPGVAGPRMLPVPRRALVAAWERGFPLWPGGESVHAPTPLAPRKPLWGKGLVVTVHDAVPFTHPETLTARGAHWHRKVIASAAAHAHTLVVPTAAVATELRLHVQDISADIAVIGHGVSAELEHPPPDAARIAAKLGLPARYLLMIGTVEPRKGIDVLIKALAEPDAPRLPLVLAGQPGWGDVQPAELAAAAGIAPPLVLGALTDPELATALHRASALVVPSRAEGFGLPLLEAMAAGVPIVHSDAPALVEVAGGTGVQAPRGDPAALAAALRTVVDDPGTTEERVTAAKTRAATFTWDNAAKKVWVLHTGEANLTIGHHR